MLYFIGDLPWPSGCAAMLHMYMYSFTIFAIRCNLAICLQLHHHWICQVNGNNAADCKAQLSCAMTYCNLLVHSPGEFHQIGWIQLVSKTKLLLVETKVLLEGNSTHQSATLCSRKATHAQTKPSQRRNNANRRARTESTSNLWVMRACLALWPYLISDNIADICPGVKRCNCFVICSACRQTHM